MGLIDEDESTAGSSSSEATSTIRELTLADWLVATVLFGLLINR